MSHFSDRPFKDPEAAARKLVDLVRTLITTSGLSHAYTGAVNLAFIRAGGTGGECVARTHHATAEKWFEVDRAGTRITLLPGGAECFRSLEPSACSLKYHRPQ